MNLNEEASSEPWTRWWDEVESPARNYIKHNTEIDVAQIYLYPSMIFEDLDIVFQSLGFQIENKIKL